MRLLLPVCSGDLYPPTHSTRWLFPFNFAILHLNAHTGPRSHELGSFNPPHGGWLVRVRVEWQQQVAQLAEWQQSVARLGDRQQLGAGLADGDQLGAGL